MSRYYFISAHFLSPLSLEDLSECNICITKNQMLIPVKKCSMDQKSKQLVVLFPQIYGISKEIISCKYIL